MVTNPINPVSGRPWLPSPHRRGRLQRALELVPVDSDHWHNVGTYRSARCAATMASRLRRKHQDGRREWEAAWRSGLDGFDLYVRPARPGGHGGHGA